MGMGYVPQDPFHPLGAGSQFQGRERRGTSLGRDSRSNSDRVAARIARARWGEDRAASWYSHNGYTVIARNWTMRGGELDVVARRGHLIVVCEVKTRANNNYGSPLEAMTPTKQARVQRAGFAFVRALNEKGLSVRFDVAAIVGTQLEIIENAF
jgi:putative endonuclease